MALMTHTTFPQTSGPGVARPAASRSRLRARWLGRRLLIGVILLLIVSFLIFCATQALPGDIARMMLGRDASAEQIIALRERLNLDAPFLLRYADWLGGVLQGNLGTSVAARMPVAELVLPRVLNSLSIVVLSMAVALPMAILAAILSAARRDGWLDRGLMMLSLLVNAMPEFVLAILLTVLLASNVFHWLPAVSLISPAQSLWSQWPNLILPALTLMLLQMTYLYRLARASLIDVLSADYIEFARLKGLSARRILFGHALPNAVVPTIQAAATVFAFSIGGVVVIEYTFNFPGIGTALTDAVRYRDIEVVQFIVLLIAATFFLSNLVADLAAAVLTPPGRGALK